MIARISIKINCFRARGLYGYAGQVSAGTLVECFPCSGSGDYYDLQIIKGRFKGLWTWGHLCNLEQISPLELLALEAE
jgi:hypothetical protein